MSDSPKTGRPAIGEPINVRLGGENLTWIDRRAALDNTTRAEVLRQVVTGAREASIKAPRMSPIDAAFIVDQFAKHDSELTARYERAAALWRAHLATANEHVALVRKAEQEAEDDAEARNAPYMEPWPADVQARITALEGAARASFDAVRECEEDIEPIVAGLTRAAREAGVDVDDVLAD